MGKRISQIYLLFWNFSFLNAKQRQEHNNTGNKRKSKNNNIDITPTPIAGSKSFSGWMTAHDDLKKRIIILEDKFLKCYSQS